MDVDFGVIADQFSSNMKFYDGCNQIIISFVIEIGFVINQD